MKVNKNNLIKLSKITDRIDMFLFKHIGQNNMYTNMFQVFQMLLLLSDEQAQVEHGFSFNSKILVEIYKRRVFICIITTFRHTS